MAKTVFVKELKEEGKVESQFMIKEMHRRSFSKKEGEFLELILKDKSGELRAICWEPGLIAEKLKKGDVVSLSGEIKEHSEFGQNLIIEPASVSAIESYDITDFIKSTGHDVDKLFAEVKDMISNIRNPKLKGLLDMLFSDDKFSEKFRLMPATMLYNHNYLGGLIEHTVNVAKLCLTIAKRYKRVDQDILVAAALLRKAGKTQEYTLSSSIDVDDEGNLLGYIILTDRILQEKIAKIDAFPEDLRIKLSHMVAARSSGIGYPTQYKPKFLEAEILAYADLLDSKAGRFNSLYDDIEDVEEDWYFDKKRNQYIFLK